MYMCTLWFVSLWSSQKQNDAILLFSSMIGYKIWSWPFGTKIGCSSECFKCQNFTGLNCHNLLLAILYLVIVFKKLEENLYWALHVLPCNSAQCRIYFKERQNHGDTNRKCGNRVNHSSHSDNSWGLPDGQVKTKMF